MLLLFQGGQGLQVPAKFYEYHRALTADLAMCVRGLPHDSQRAVGFAQTEPRADRPLVSGILPGRDAR